MKQIESSFFTFWVQRYKVSFLMAFLILFLGIFSLFQIPKESFPDIKFGIISVTTVYPWVSPSDMDNLITEKIEKEIEDLDGIKKITSTSGVGVSSVVVELENDTNVRDTMTDIRDALDTLSLPEDAQDPKVQEISTMSELMFQALLYAPEDKISSFELNVGAKKIQNALEGKYGIVSIDIGAGGWDGGVGVSWGGQEEYEIQVLLSREKLELLWISIPQVAWQLQAYNRNTPIGNYAVGDIKYDFRFDGEFTDENELYNLVIRENGSSQIRLKDIATFEKKYVQSDDTLRKVGFYEKTGYKYISLNFNKKAGANIFSVSQASKAALEAYISKQAEFEWLEVVYTQDLSESIKDDYKQLSNNWLQTLVFVFIIVFLFIGVRESFIALALITLSFAITFIALDGLGRSLNFLTNFSLVLSFGIAVDTLTVIIEGAVQKQKLGYSTRNAVLISIKELKSSLIVGTFATLFAFLPMIFLPGIIGKFLSYIPITTFFMLGAALFVSLTLAAAFFIKLSKDFSFYFPDSFQEDILSLWEKKILDQDRVWKIASKAEKESKRLAFLSKMVDSYYKIIFRFVHRKSLRLLAVFGPVLFLVLTFVILSPRIWFTIFPQSDEGVININLETREGSETKSLETYLSDIDTKLSTYPEIKTFVLQGKGNALSISIELFPLTQREAKNQRGVFEIETLILKDFSYFESQGLKVSVQSQGWGPPISKPVWIKLIVDDNRNIETLRQVAGDFESYLKSQSGLKNISLSSKDSPGQFVFRFQNERLSLAGLTPQDIIGQVYSSINGMKVGTITSEFEDNDIVLKIGEFSDELTPENIENLVVSTKIGNVRVGDFVTYSFEKSLSSIGRENGDITITVDADILPGEVATSYQPKLIAFAQNYNFPDGVSYTAGGEGEENKELVVSTIKSFFIALFLIFGILVLQFNSYSQPMMILYSAILAIWGVNVGLFLTGNPYSMPFAIGFISLLGILINNSIILIETINSNIRKIIALKGAMSQEEYMNSIISAGTSRFQAIIITLVINLVGVLPIAFQDAFWAGIGFTIVFGLLAGTFLTLFSLPSLYYMLYYKRYVKKT